MNFKSVYIFIKNILSLIGGLFILCVILLLFFGESSKQRRDTIFNTIDSFIGLGPKYDGFIANTPKKYFKVFYLNIKNKFTKFDYPSVYLEINLRNLKKLDFDRKKKFTDDNFHPDYVNAVLKISDPKKPEEYKDI